MRRRARRHPSAARSTHGTWVAGIVAAADNGVGTIGVAPEAKIVAVRVCHEPDGPCPFSAILAGIVYAADAGADVINLSIEATLPRRALVDEQGNVIPPIRWPICSPRSLARSDSRRVAEWRAS